MRNIINIFIIFLLLLTCNPQYVLASNISLSGGRDSLTVNDEYTVSAILSIANSSNNVYYLRGVFYKPKTTRYCGYTWNGSSWFKGPYSTDNGWKNFLQISMQNNSWSGQLKAKIDPTDSGCSDSGTYKFKIERFTSAGSGSFDSQIEKDVQVIIPTPSPALSAVAPFQVSIIPTPLPDSGLSQADSGQALSTESTTQSVATVAQATNPISSLPDPTTTILDQINTSDKTGLQPEPTATPDSRSDQGLVLGLKVDPTSSGLSKDQGIMVKNDSQSGIWYLFFMGGILLMAGCGILLFQMKKRK